MSPTEMCHKTRIAFGLAVLLIPLFFGETVNACDGRGPAGQNQSDDEVIAALASRDREEAYRAVEETVKRGERMIPLLLRHKGDRKFFYGYGLGHRDSSFTTPDPASFKGPGDGSVITVEVAALYLISAIYYQTLEFAQAPYLTDGTPVKWQKFNTRKRVASAWASVENWVRLLDKDGLESLRARRHHPLKDSPARFWGTAQEG